MFHCGIDSLQCNEVLSVATNKEPLKQPRTGILIIMKKLHFMTVALACIVAFASVSCNEETNADDRAGIDYKTIDLTADNSLLIENVSEQDPEAAYPVSMSMKLDGTNLVVSGKVTYPREGLGLGLGQPCANDAAIADYGKAHSLGSISKIPEESEFSNNIACQVGHGYVIKAWGNANLNAYGQPTIHDPAPFYVRVYIADELENGGFRVRYQYPFTED